MLKIFLINLKRRSDRLVHVKQQLDQLGLEFERFDAFDGTMLSPTLSEENQKFQFNVKRKIALGEIGCAMSHRAIWQRMVEQNLPFALILEDDITIRAELVGFLADLNNYQHFDFLNLSYIEPYRVDPQALDYFVSRQKLRRPHIFHQDRSEWRKLEWNRSWRIFQIHPTFNQHYAMECDPAPLLGSGYIVSLHAAQALLKASERFEFPIDWVWRYASGQLVEGFTYPCLVTQSLNDSNINDRHYGNRLPLKQKIRRFWYKHRKFARRVDLWRMYGLLMF
ncbi:MAG: glycosyltransferase family 25 protein [Moraxellaceae bacterium]